MKLSELPEIDDTLREYQKKSKQEIYAAWESSTSVLFQMPTGTGKTRLFSSIIRDTMRQSLIEKKRKGVLVLAHRLELIDQISDTLAFKYHIAHGIIQSKHPEEKKFAIQVASVQTIVRKLDSWKEKPFSYIIIDEAHHALAKTYKKICSAFPDARILGVTATPCRLADAGLREVFGTLVLSQPVQDFIDQGWLSQYSYYSIAPYSSVQQDIDNIDKFAVDGDYAEQAMMDVCDKAKVRAGIIDAYRKYAEGKKGIIYTINQQHNDHICEEYKKIGVNIKSIDSNTPAKERKQVVAEFRSGKVQIICNVNIFSEGFDCPDIEFIQLARPTKSLSMYLQQVGRGLRPHEKKDHAIIIDNVGSYNRFGLPSAHREWRRLFEGAGVDGSQSTVKKKTNKKLPPKKQEFKEGDEEMLLIYSGEGVTHSEINENQHIEEFLHFPVAYDLRLNSSNPDIPLIRYGLDYFYNYNEWINEIVEPYINDLSLELDYDIDISDIPVYKAKINGKYGLYDGGEKYKGHLMTSATAELLNKDFRTLLEPIYDEIGIPDSRGMMICSRDGKYGVINGDNMCIDVPFKYDSIEHIQQLYDKYIVSKKGKFGIVSKDDVLVPLKYSEINFPVGSRSAEIVLFANDGENEGFYQWDHDKNALGALIKPEIIKKYDNYIVAKVANNGLVFLDHNGNTKLPIFFSKIARTNKQYKLSTIYVETTNVHAFFNDNFELIGEPEKGAISPEFLEKSSIITPSTTPQIEAIQKKKTPSPLSGATPMSILGGRKILSYKNLSVYEYKGRDYMFVGETPAFNNLCIRHIYKEYFMVKTASGYWKVTKYVPRSVSIGDNPFVDISEAQYHQVRWNSTKNAIELISKGKVAREIRAE